VFWVSLYPLLASYSAAVKLGIVVIISLPRYGL
jgi:hypothetical protein